jgi:hypothetical protein
MAFPVENFSVEQVAIPVRERSKGDVTLAVRELPRHEAQHVLGGRKVQGPVKLLLRIVFIENVGIP